MLSQEFLIERGYCCGHGCLMCPYVPKHTKDNKVLGVSIMKVSIEYCMQWSYEPKAFSLKESIQRQFGVEAQLIEGSGGVFEVMLNNSLIFSKKKLDRFPHDNEIEDILDSYEWIT